MTFKTYKTIEHLKKRCIKNNGKPVNLWDDWGIKINGRIYKLLEYGNMGYNFTGNCYINFYNKSKNDYITIEYNLTKNPDKGNGIFQFVLIRENR